MSPVVPTVTLNNGVVIPQLGFGVFQIPDDQTQAAVEHALEAGYRSIDTAALYRNERGVARAVETSGIPREELFITTKLWNDRQGDVPRAFEESLEKLGTDYVDLYLIHWPAPKQDRYLEAWQAFESLYADGRVRAIGVSNFLPEHLERVVALGGTVPAVNQIEAHPALQQRAAQEADRRHGVATEAWSPLAQAAVLTDDVVTTIAEAHAATPAQVVLAWHRQQGRIAIPKSVTPSRIVENLASVEVTLTDEELARIDGLESGGRTGPDPATFG